jgi:hypothetical protein
VESTGSAGFAKLGISDTSYSQVWRTKTLARSPGAGHNLCPGQVRWRPEGIFSQAQAVRPEGLLRKGLSALAGLVSTPRAEPGLCQGVWGEDPWLRRESLWEQRPLQAPEWTWAPCALGQSHQSGLTT